MPLSLPTSPVFAAAPTSSVAWPSWSLDGHQLAELDLLVAGAATPAGRYLSRVEHETATATLRLPDGTVAPWPVVLEVSDAFAETLEPGTVVGLRDGEGILLAGLTIDDRWKASPDGAALGGSVQLFEPPRRAHFRGSDAAPAAIRAQLEARQWNDLVVADPGDLPTRADHASLTAVAASRGAALQLQAAVPASAQPSAVRDRLRVLRALLADYPPATTALALLPMPRSRGDERDLWLRAAVAAAAGASALVVPSALSGIWTTVAPARRSEVTALLGIDVIAPRPFVYVAARAAFVAAADAPANGVVPAVTGDDLRDLLAKGEPLPPWVVSGGVAAELARQYPPRFLQGVTVFFTGLSGSGKSTIAAALHAWLLDHDDRQVTMLDGDLVRRQLSSELGFSAAHRALNVRRIGYVAAEVTRHRGLAICAPIAPSDAVRREVRAGAEAVGGFLLVHVDTPLEECERRDRKGLYAKARAGLLPALTGVSDPYERPADAEVVIDTTTTTVEAAVQRIVEALTVRGYLRRWSAEPSAGVQCR